MDTQTWFNQLQDFIFNLLGSFIKPEERARKYVSDEKAMRIWADAFTAPTINPNDNYETLETRGDALLKGIFIGYMMDRYENIDPDQITGANSYYMGKEYHLKLAKELGFDKWIRTTKLTDDIIKDIFESFVGALYMVSRMIDQKPLAYAVCDNFIVWLFQNVKLDFVGTQPKKTFVQQAISRFGLDPVYERKTQENDKIVIYIEVSNAVLEFFAKREAYLPVPLGFGSGATKTIASNNAYKDAFDKLSKAGVTREWLKKQKELWDFSDLEFAPYIERARANLVKLGYVNMFFVIPSKTKDTQSMSISLIGIRKDPPQHEPIETIVTGDTEKEGKRKLLQNLAELKIK